MNVLLSAVVIFIVDPFNNAESIMVEESYVIIRTGVDVLNVVLSNELLIEGNIGVVVSSSIVLPPSVNIVRCVIFTVTNPLKSSVFVVLTKDSIAIHLF